MTNLPDFNDETLAELHALLILHGNTAQAIARQADRLAIGGAVVWPAYLDKLIESADVLIRPDDTPPLAWRQQATFVTMFDGHLYLWRNFIDRGGGLGWAVMYLLVDTDNKRYTWSYEQKEKHD